MSPKILNMVNIFRLIGNKLDLFRMCRDVSRCVTMYVELITILVRAKDDITRACRRCQSTLYIVFNIAEVGGPHKMQEDTRGFVVIDVPIMLRAGLLLRKHHCDCDVSRSENFGSASGVCYFRVYIISVFCVYIVMAY